MQVRVHNDNIYPYKEQFREHLIEIPAKGSILMEKDEAEIFQGTFAGIRTDGEGNVLPQGYKMIRIEYGSADGVLEAPKVDGFRCEMDGKVFKSEAELKSHIETNYKARIIVDAEAEREIEARKATTKGRRSA